MNSLITFICAFLIGIIIQACIFNVLFERYRLYMNNEQKIAQLDPEFQPIVREIIKDLTDLGYPVQVAEGKRTLAEQREKVRLRYSKTMHSYHLTGRAVDLVDARYQWEGKANTVIYKFWHDLGKTALKAGQNNKNVVLRWGGLWGDGDFIDTEEEKRRWYLYEKAVQTGNIKLITWFCDVAHVEMRK